MLWRGKSDRWERMPEWWVRGLPVAVVAAWPMLIGVPLTVIGMTQHGTIADLFAIALGAVLFFIVLAAITWLTVVLFNRPRFAVPDGWTGASCQGRSRALTGAGHLVSRSCARAQPRPEPCARH